MTRTTVALEQGQLPNTCQYTARTDRGDYLVQVAWPLGWSDDRVPPEDERGKPVSTVYLVDGNAYFFTAVDVTRRLEFTSGTRNVVVGVGYPPSKYVYDWRRGPDLTPPTPDGRYEAPLDGDGNPMDLGFGEAHKFLDFIWGRVMSYVEATLFPDAPLEAGRKAVFGHSYGGVFALNALYTQPGLFDLYIAASPTIWWSDYALVKNQEAQFCRRNDPAPAPSLMITWGTGAQELERRPGESEADFRNRKSIAEDEKMRSSAEALVARLEGCATVRHIWTAEFQGEDHGSAAVVGLQRGIMKFLVP